MWIIKTSQQNETYWLCPVKSQYTVGRGVNQNIKLTSASISRKHARFTLKEGTGHSRLFIEDMGGKFGTTVNGKQVQDQVELKQGDLLQIGQEVYLQVVMETVSIFADNYSGHLQQYQSNSTSCDYSFTDHLGTATHMLMSSRVLTPSSLVALAKGLWIVNDKYLRDVAMMAQKFQSVKDSEIQPTTMPDPANYVPQEDLSELLAPNASWLPNSNRSSLFRGMSFFVYSKSDLQSVIQAAGGVYVEVDGESAISQLKSAHGVPYFVYEHIGNIESFGFHTISVDAIRKSILSVNLYLFETMESTEVKLLLDQLQSDEPGLSEAETVDIEGEHSDHLDKLSPVKMMTVKVVDIVQQPRKKPKFKKMRYAGDDKSLPVDIIGKSQMQQSSYRAGFGHSDGDNNVKPAKLIKQKRLSRAIEPLAVVEEIDQRRDSIASRRSLSALLKE